MAFYPPLPLPAPIKMRKTHSYILQKLPFLPKISVVLPSNLFHPFYLPHCIMKNLMIVASLAVAMFFAGCGGANKKAQEAADLFCKCSGPMADLAKKMKGATPEQMAALATEAQGIVTESASCAKGMEDLTKGMTEEAKAKFEKASEEAARKKCPDTFAAIDEMKKSSGM